MLAFEQVILMATDDGWMQFLLFVKNYGDDWRVWRVWRVWLGCGLLLLAGFLWKTKRFRLLIEYSSKD